MEPVEPTETLNTRLSEYFGRSWDNRPVWRIVYSDEQFEKQLCEYSANGILLLVPEWREVHKYGWIKHKYVLERLVAVPEINTKQLTTKTSYEPMWTFEDKFGNALPPKWEACELVVNTMLAATGQKSMRAKYIDPMIEHPVEERRNRINKLQDDLFGNETEVGDALAHKQAIIVPRNYKDNN